MEKAKKISLIKQMLVMQDNFNKVVNEDWAKAGFAWNRAIWLESAELVESLPWKWWKHIEPDVANARVETVDIWHFVMSGQIVIYGMDNIDMLADLIYTKVFADLLDEPVFDAEKLIHHTEKLAMYSADDKPSLFQVSQVIKYAGFNLENMFKEYVIKNTLNGFRQENGYKDGSYVKQWTWFGATAEDNLVVGSLAEHILLDEDFGSNLKEAMENEYRKTVA